MNRAALLAIVLALALAGCGGGADEATPTTTGTATTPTETIPVEAYFLRDGKVWPVMREVARTQAVATAALGELRRGPTDQETADLGMSSALPTDDAPLDSISVTDGVARYSSSEDLSRDALAQVVYTLTQFPTVESVEIDGTTYTRADFEDVTPAILVESPLAFEEVGSPLRVTGTANTFEATFEYELTDTDGRIVDGNFVTATSGTGERGTFDFTTKAYAVPFDGVGSLVVFERSAKDGSRVNLVEIPLRMEK